MLSINDWNQRYKDTYIYAAGSLQYVVAIFEEKLPNNRKDETDHVVFQLKDIRNGKYTLEEYNPAKFSLELPEMGLYNTKYHVANISKRMVKQFKRTACEANTRIDVPYGRTAGEVVKLGNALAIHVSYTMADALDLTIRGRRIATAFSRNNFIVSLAGKNYIANKHIALGRIVRDKVEPMSKILEQELIDVMTYNKHHLSF